MIYLPGMTQIVALLLVGARAAGGGAEGRPVEIALRRQEHGRLAHLQDRHRRRRCATTPGAKDCWEIKDGVLQKDGHANDIASREQFGDFELELEWKIGDASNSGVFYRGTDEFNQIYWSAPEYQLLDNVNAADNKKDNHLAGSVYDLYAVAEGRREAGRRVEPDAHRREGHPRRALAERQEGRVVRRRQPRLGRGHTARASSRRTRTSAKAPKGYLGIQGDHPGTLALRNIRIRELH